MSGLPGRLGTLTAQDIMTPQIIVLNEDDTLMTAIQVLKANRITGAPVVDVDGVLRGVLSLTDLLFPVGQQSSAESSDSIPVSQRYDDSTAWELFDQAQPLDADTQQELIKTRMKTLIISVQKTTPLVEVSRMMCDRHRHRVPVVDEAGKLCGIISTMDILAALVHVNDEFP